jgi:hypothetical protein
MADRHLVRLVWRALDELDYQVMQARFWLCDLFCSPELRMIPDEWRKFD